MFALRSARWIRLGSILILAVLVVAGFRPAIAEELAETALGREATESAGSDPPVVTQLSPHRPAAHPLVDRRLLLGHSSLGRSIYAFERGDPTSRTTMLVVGCIHGDECAGIAIAHSLISGPLPRAVDLWVIPDLNPDGTHAGTRQNGRGVDLNRNFPYRWRPLGKLGSDRYSGARPLSEPEARIASRLIIRVRPVVTIWFHQPLGLVDLSGGDATIERRFSRLVGLPLVRLRRYPGSVATWQNHRFPQTTAFVVELPTGSLSPTAAGRYADAVMDVGDRGAKEG